MSEQNLNLRQSINVVTVPKVPQAVKPVVTPAVNKQVTPAVTPVTPIPVSVTPAETPKPKPTTVILTLPKRPDADHYRIETPNETLIVSGLQKEVSFLLCGKTKVCIRAQNASDSDLSVVEKTYDFSDIQNQSSPFTIRRF